MEIDLAVLHKLNESFIKVVLEWREKQAAIAMAITEEKGISELSKAIADAAEADRVLEISTDVYVATQEVINSKKEKGKDEENGSDESASS